MIWASAQGKVNLYFQVGDLQPDGYHPVVSLYQALDLQERVGVEPSGAWEVRVVSDLPNLGEIPLDESNLVVKAAKTLAKFAGIENPQPMQFEIQKQVPVAGGMAGGSADAAAALVALNEAWGLGLDQAELMKVGGGIGADVPFAILGGTALGSDTGIELAELALKDFGCGPGLLSGSGPTLWYLAADDKAAEVCAENIRAAGFQAVVANPSSAGSRLI